MVISLIQTSQNRRKELTRFVRSLNQQQGIDFKDVQLIFVDQENNRDVFQELNKEVMFNYIQTSHCSLSHARNIAIPLVKGKYVAFPDDDCWYEPNTIAMALKVLDEGYDGVSGKGTNKDGKLTSIFPDCENTITPIRRCAAISYTMFFKFNPTVKFDENMGVGSPYNLGAGEETDYMLNLIESFSYRLKYSPDIVVHHPCAEDNLVSKECLLKKAYSYARGGGYLMQKHKFPISYYAKQFVRPLGGIFFYSLKGDFYNVKKSHLLFKGRIEGYFSNLK